MDVLVSPAWALEHLGDPSVRFVEVDVDTAAYERGHLPGAVGWDWTRQLADGVRRDVVSRGEFAGLLSRSGIARDTTVVVYGDGNNWFATWAYWLLRLFGHPDVRVLDGGRRYWLEHDLPFTTEVPSPSATVYELPDPDPRLRALRDDILARLDDPELALVDVRSPAEFAGEVTSPPGLPESAQRGGHIPGAVSIPWGQAVREDGTFRDPDELRALYGGHGVTPDRDVVTYCRIGERSSHSWYVLHELLGYPRVRNYDGSWMEWGNMIGMPIEKPVVGSNA